MELRGSSGRNRARGFDCHPSVSEYVQLYLYDMKESVTSSTAITYCITSTAVRRTTVSRMVRSAIMSALSDGVCLGGDPVAS